ncbi:MAG: DUF1492 domain-containing protein [Oscillospiraceae bacterium]
MTVDEVKAELKRVRAAKKAYRLANDRANDYEQTLTGGKTVRYGGNGESHENRGNPVENAYCELISLKDDKEQHRREYIAAFTRARYLIDLVADPAQREVLDRRYIRGELWEDIAVSMNYSRRHINRLHGWALQCIARQAK